MKESHATDMMTRDDDVDPAQNKPHDNNNKRAKLQTLLQ